MSIDIDELERKAQSVTPGPWKVQHPNTGWRGWEVANSTGLERICADITKSRAHYIAAANPAAVLELVREVRRLRAELKASQAREGALRKALEECLSWVDAWCDTSPETGFDEIERLTDSVLDMPTDDTALRQAIKVAKEEMRERAAKRFDGMPGYEAFGPTIADDIRALEVE